MAFFGTSPQRIPSFRAFSSAYRGIARELRSEVRLRQAFNPADMGIPAPESRKYVALWDTGATHSCIDSRVVADLGLVAVGKAECSHVHGHQVTSKYLVDMVLPNKVGVSEVSVMECTLSHGIDVIIGMDIITLGDFAVTNHNDKTHFSFRTPSCSKTCYVEDANRLKAQNPPKTTMVAAQPRNSKCVCGSGKKYKRCCGDPSSNGA